ncbi:MAG: hypothetical protein JSW04_04150 [Desulfobacterales bacterium]|nr:MAG: hypothetical protein JSW04_04150 [Desulfobacterales bacterium]
MNPEMFREYDIRGIAGKDMNDDDVMLIGKGVGTFLREHGRSRLTVGRDCRLLEILTDTGKTISQLLSGLPETYSTPEIRVDCPDDKKFLVVEKATEFFRERFPIIDIDGVRILFDDGWGLIRASNTQPALVLRFEAMSEPRLSEIRHLVESALEDIEKT